MGFARTSFGIGQLTAVLGDGLKTLLIIPAYNEEKCIERVVNNVIENYPQFDYVVVNDGSRDATPDICRAHGYRFLDLPINLGLAGAFQAGIKYARNNGYDCAIQLDADGQHEPEYVQPLVDALSTCDIAIGSRFVDKPKPKSMRMFGSNLISNLIKLTTGKRIKDPTSGMRAYGKRAIACLAVGPNLGPEPDTLSYLIRKHDMQIREIQVEMRERMAGESYLNAKASIAYMTRITLSILIFQYFR